MKEPSPLADRNTRASGKCHPWLGLVLILSTLRGAVWGLQGLPSEFPLLASLLRHC